MHARISLPHVLRPSLRAIALGALAALTLGIAPAPAQAKDAKVAYVNMQRALLEVNDGKKAKDKLRKDYEAKQKKLTQMQEDFGKKKNAFESRKAMMKPDAIQAKMEELQREYVQLEQTYMQLEKELSEQQAKAIQDIARKLKAVVEKIGDREGYDMIFNIGDNVLYFKRHQEITDQVVREYNRQYAP